MPSTEHEQLVRALRSDRGERPPTDLEELRRGFEALTARFALAADVRSRTAEVGGVSCEWLWVPQVDTRCVILYLHGGNYVAGSIRTHRELASRLARMSRACVLLPEYRLAPEHPFPAAVLDACTVYRALLPGLDAGQLAIVGDAAGGGLALATLMALRDAAEELPAAAVCLSPWLDLEATGASAQSGAVDDPLLRAEALRGWAQLYAGEQLLRDPLAAPLYGDCEELPPLLLQVGTREILLDDAVRFTELAQRAGVDVTLERWQGLVHAWPLLGPELPEAEQALGSVARFLQRHWHS